MGLSAENTAAMEMGETMDSAPPMTSYSPHSVAGGNKLGAISRQSEKHTFVPQHDIVGRADLQVLQSVRRAYLPNMSGDVAMQMSKALHDNASYAAQDPLPTGMHARYNRFASIDLRGDPMGDRPYKQQNTTMKPISFGGSDEFVQFRHPDTVAPIPGIGGVRMGDGTYRAYNPQKTHEYRSY